MTEQVFLNKTLVGNILTDCTLSSFKWLCATLFILLKMKKREVGDDFRSVSTQEFKAVIFCVSPLREGNHHQTQVSRAGLSKVGIKLTSFISLGQFQ